MCDTLVTFDRDKNRSFFGKNSDREPAELQFVYISNNPEYELIHSPYLEEKEEYIRHSFRTLTQVFHRFHNSYRAILSRPLWMWGAEMGVNEFGLSIGNEAVFSREKVNRDGLLGMDILRLALHNSKTAEEAVDFIIKLITEVGQGGDGGYRGSLKYHNSFLIKDFKDAFVLETSSKHWALKRVDTCASISNSYSIEEDYDKSDRDIYKSFKKEHQDKVFSFFSRGDRRQSITKAALGKNPKSLGGIRDILRSHHSESIYPIRGMSSVCMHSGRVIKSETTSSMIVDYIGDKFVVWYTAGPHPCVTAYKPLVFLDNDEFFYDAGKALEYTKKISETARKSIEKYQIYLENVKPLRDELEDRFEKIVYRDIENKSLENLAEDIDECRKIYRALKLYI